MKFVYEKVVICTETVSEEDFVNLYLKEIHYKNYEGKTEYWFLTQSRKDGFLEVQFTLPETLFSANLEDFNYKKTKTQQLVQHIIDVLKTQNL